MKKLSIRTKITLWFSAVLAVIVFLAFVIVFFVSDAVLQKGVRDNLVETVENNVGEIKYFGTLQEATDSGGDLYLKYREGYLEIDDNFLDQVNGIYTGLYTEDGALLYGVNLLYRGGAKAFQNGGIQTLTVEGEGYYVFDRRLEQGELEGLWLRGIVSKRQGYVQQSAIVRISLIVMPILVILAVLGGYLIAGRALRPIREIESAAKAICEGKDLKKRIRLAPGADELHRLADTFNDMLGRLEDSFDTEKRFISDASHELRTPMSVIEAQCELIMEKPREAGEYEKALQVIRRQSRKMSRLIGELLDFTRLEQNRGSYVKEPTDMTQLVSSVCEDMAVLREQEILLTYAVAPDISVNGNRALLIRLLTNLISNAYRYGRPGGNICVRLEKEKEEILLTVEDDGIGIAPEEQDKVFGRFYQSDTSRSGQGTGLGLAMVREIAVFHGGTVQVESAPGQGSKFIFSMPVF